MSNSTNLHSYKLVLFGTYTKGDRQEGNQVGQKIVKFTVKWNHIQERKDIKL